MRVLLIAMSRWAAEGLAAALQRAAGGEPMNLQALSLDEWRRADAGSHVPIAELAVLAGLPASDAREALKRLPQDLPVLWLAGDGDAAAEFARASPARAFGWLPDDIGEAPLHAAVRALAHGLSVRQADGSSLFPGPQPSAAQELREPLTARELEVFELMAKGLGNRDIAGALGISSHTAKFHVAQILDKTGSATRTEAVHHGLRLGLVGL
ncbi:MAG TPA: response regulator transcription factor [Ideonella sp.]|nr:response regulator transcription factor [Ideonella sp.]